MNTKMFRMIATASVAAAFAAGGAMAQDSKIDPKKPVKAPVETKAEKGKADEKVAGDDSKNSTAPAVAKRAGAYSCDVHIDNRTNYYIHRVYIDGRNWGGVGRFGDAMARDVSTGATRLYAEADFSDGSTSRWGPTVFNCNSYATHHWRLN